MMISFTYIISLVALVVCNIALTITVKRLREAFNESIKTATIIVTGVEPKSALDILRKDHYQAKLVVNEDNDI